MFADFKYTCRSIWWDTRSLRRLVWLLEAWQTHSPATYAATKRLYRRLKPTKQKPAGRSKSSSLPQRGSVVTVSGIRLKMNESLSDAAIRRLSSGWHTKDERFLILDNLERDDIVMELGGGVGMLAIACAQKIGSERVFSYEANPAMEPVARENFSLNNVSPSMEFCILDHEPGSQTFYVCQQFNESSTTRMHDTDTPIQVPVKPINAEIAGIQPTFLVMDIQGSEDGLLEHVNLSGLSRLMIEYHPHINGEKRVIQLRKYVRKQGYLEVARQGNSILYIRRS